MQHARPHWLRTLSASLASLAVLSSTAAAAVRTPSAHAALHHRPLASKSAIRRLEVRVLADERAPRFVPPGPAIDISSLKGKKVFLIPQAPNPFVNGITASMQRIAKKTGIDLIVYPNQGLASQWVQGMEEAIAQKVNLIVLSAAPDPRELQPQLQQAKAAHIPVLVTHFYDQSDPLPPKCLACAAGVSAIVPAPFDRAGRDEADWIMLHTHFHAHVLIVGATEDIVTRGIIKTMKHEYATYCGSACSTKVILIPPSQWGTKVEPEVASALTADPSLNVVDNLFDAQVPGAVQAITTLGKKIPVVSFNGSTSALEYIKNHDVAAMDVGESVDWIGYASFDQAFRLLLKKKPGNDVLPLRIWDASNIAGVGNPPNLLDGYGHAYVTGFDKLWGLKA
jgi:ribose transport system substrate-binding protein